MTNFIIHSDYEQTLKGLTNEEVGELIKALIYHTEGTEIEIISPTVKAVFPIIAGHIDRDIEYRRKSSEFGKKGGAPVGNTNAKNKGKTRVNKGNTRVEQGSDKGKQTPIPIPIPNKKNIYGVRENVLLTEEEYKKVIDAGLEELIDELSLYIDSKGAKYKSHYSTILAWARRRDKDKVKTFTPKTNNFTQIAKRDYDLDELEKRLVKN